MQHPALTSNGRNGASALPWTLRAWPPLLWQVGDPAPEGFHHLSTQVVVQGGPKRAAGQTFWGGVVAGAEAGVAWDWVEIADGIVAMADPMSVMTNLRLVGDEGEVLAVHEAARFLNCLVHRLPWQAEVERQLSIRH